MTAPKHTAMPEPGALTDAHGLTAEDWGVPPHAYADMKSRYEAMSRSHAALVEALREVVEMCTPIPDSDSVYVPKLVMAKARAALALAGEE